MGFKGVKPLLLGGLMVWTAGSFTGCTSTPVATPPSPVAVDPTAVTAEQLASQEQLAVEHPVDFEIWTTLAEYYLGSRNCSNAVKTGYYALTLEKENPRAQKVVDICLAEKEARNAYQRQREAAILEAREAQRMAREREQREAARQAALRQQKEREREREKERERKASAAQRNPGPVKSSAPPASSGGSQTGTSAAVSNRPVVTSPKPSAPPPAAAPADPFKLVR